MTLNQAEDLPVMMTAVLTDPHLVPVGKLVALPHCQVQDQAKAVRPPLC